MSKGPPILLDGPTGTQVADRGIDTSGPLWSARALLEAPEVVERVHAAYARAGAEVHTTCTFRTQPGRFEAQGLGRDTWRDTIDGSVAAVEAGLEQAGADRRAAWIAGSMAPIGDCYTPEEVPDQATLGREHTPHARALAGAGVDLLLVETMLDAREARVAVQAALDTGLPVWCSFVVGDEARLLAGTPLADAVRAVTDLGVQAVLVNCASPPRTDQAVEILAEASPVPWGAYPNGALGDPSQAWGPRVAARTFASTAHAWLQAGARILGSCCVTTPAHTRVLADLCHRRAPP